MDPISVEAVLGAVETAASGALGGAAGEMGRRAAEGLARLRRRERRSGEDEGGGDGGGPPVGVDEVRRVAEGLSERARVHPEFARELLAWVRETEAPRLGIRHVPQVLPPVSGVFTDREAVLAALEEMIGDGGRAAAAVAVVTGQGGIGKTAAAVYCGHRLKNRFPDGQLFVRLGGPAAEGAVRAGEALAVLLGDLGVAPDRIPADPQRQENLYRDLTAGRRILVLLDDAACEAQVRPLIPASPGSLVIVTSRYRLSGLAGDPGARFLTLDPLAEADAVLLLERVAAAGGRRDGARDAARMAAVARRCGRVPLALCETGALVAARAHLSWETVERRLGGPSGNPGGMDDHNGMDAVRRTHDLAYRELSPEAARLYRLLGFWPGPETGVEAAARVAGTTEGAARVLLEELAGVHLLQEVGEERYRFHDLVRADAERRARAEDGPAELAASVRRAVGWYLRFAAAADFRVMPGRWRLGPAYDGLTPAADRDPHDGRATLAELRRERVNLAAAVRAAEDFGHDDLVWQLCEATWGLHLRLGFHDQWIDTHRRGVAAARRRAEEFGDASRAEGRVLSQLAFAYMGRGQWDEAERALTEAADADRAAGHLRGQATAVESLGLLRLRQWRWQEAQDCFTTAQGLLRRIGPEEDGATDVPRGLALLEDHIGRALRGAGRHAEAVRTLHTALAMFRALPVRDLYNEGRVYMSLGETHLAAGDPAAARLCLDEALAVMDREGAELQQADAAEMRARCAEDGERRLFFLRRAEELYEKGGDAVGVARVRAGLAGE
ncbi:tetratricopeptide repeat protein [Streptomyces huiliensis]|uniref:tetratricopeptide repeat protein n=1 Tax=Streptomyces huiliensis TaxID=2876027 RepID=UPI001CBF9A3B|nr:tetratricopeptide repeat protein [Streptomyces huiliensis]MBZ4320340.1 tetratricopeptide repeat protein [Streptomyces huiliensis]